MKIKLTMEIEVPDGYINNNDKGEYIPGISWSMAYATQAIFDNFVNYSICKHLNDACKAYSSGYDKEMAEYIANSHQQWANVLHVAETTMKIEEVV